jgi:hypothetical protein
LTVHADHFSALYKIVEFWKSFISCSVFASQFINKLHLFTFTLYFSSVLNISFQSLSCAVIFKSVYAHANTLLSVVVSILNFATGQGTTERDMFLTQQLSDDEHNETDVRTFHIVFFPSL